MGVNAGVHVLNITTRAFIGNDPDAPSLAGAGDVHALGTVRIAADDRPSSPPAPNGMAICPAAVSSWT